MPDPVIQVENLGKQYCIRHEQPERYVALRDVMARRVRGFFRRLKGPRAATPTRAAREEFWALRDLSFRIEAGEVVGIIGRNGAGKSTLLKVLSRITEPTTGRVRLRGRVGSLLEVGTGFHPELTGRENVFLNGAILGMSHAEIRRKFDEIVAFAEVERFLDTPVKRYSSGMYVRLAFAVAAHLEPEILIVDEVLAVGDALFQKKCLSKMEEVSQGGRTVLYVSHSLSTVRRLCTRGLLLNEGRLVADATPEEAINCYVKLGQQYCADYERPTDPAKRVCLRRAQLLDRHGAASAEIRFEEGCKVRLEYEVRQRVPNLAVWIAVRTLEEVMLFCTADYDVGCAALPAREAGLYRAEVEWPAAWINAGDYRLVVGLIGHHPPVTYERVEPLQFQVVDHGNYVFADLATRRGLFKPLLPWQTRQLS